MTLTSDLVRLAVEPEDLGAYIKAVQANAGLVETLQLQAALESARHLVASDISDPLGRVIRNNTNGDIQAILGRPDTQRRLGRQSSTVDASATQTIRAAHYTGYVAGQKAARAEAKSLGLRVPKPTSYLEGNSSYMDSVLSDLHSNLGLLSGRQQVAIAQAFDAIPQEAFTKGRNVAADQARARAAAVAVALDKESRRTAMRIRAGASVAVTRGANEARIAEFQAVQDANPNVVVRKVWVCRFGANTCGTCASLHGSVIALEGSFDEERTFAAGAPPKVYHDLAMPPRHPHCRCSVTIHIEELGDTKPMRSAARLFAEKADDMAPRSWAAGVISDTAKTTQFMTSSDFRAISDSQFDLAMASFRACLLS